jgi:hypothetical protein
MEQADQTLHDFVLNLLSDSQALAAFEQDPAAVLDNAGLSGISAVDVQEVIPLVIDYVPVHAQVLDSVLSQLPLDSVSTGQLGAIQQLQFVTQALGGLPGLSTGDVSLGDPNTAGGLLNLTSDGQGHIAGLGELTTPLGGGAGSLTADIQNGVEGALWEHSAAGSVSTDIQVPGLGSLPGLPGLPSLPGVGGLASGFSAASDLTNALDGGALGSVTGAANVTGTVTSNVNTAANLLTGAADLTAGALANPSEVVGALSNPTAAVAALTGVAENYAEYGTSSLPAPANALAGQALQTASGVGDTVVGHVQSVLPTDALSGVTSHLPVGDPAQAVGTVQGVVSQVTGTLGSTGALSGITGHLDATHVVTGAVSDVTGTVSGSLDATASASASTDGSVASQSVVGNVTGITGAAGSVTTATHAVTSDLNHVTDALHVPGL